jgi:hypothetical protein
MDEKELLLKQIEQMITDSQKESVTKREVEKSVKELNEKIAKFDNDELADLKKSVDAIVENLKKVALKQNEMDEKATVASSKPKSFRDAMEAAIMEKKDLCLTEINDSNGKRLSLKEYFTEKGHHSSPVFTMKAAVDMISSEIVQANVSTLRLTELDPNRVSVPLTLYPHVMNVLPKKQISKPSMALLVVYTYWDGSAVKPEGTASAKSSFLFKTVSFPAFYIATHFVLSDETLDDLQEALDEINLVAPGAINDKIDSFILGTAGDDSSSIKGLFAAAKSTAFVPATYANFVANASIIDLIAAMKLQCEASKYVPDTVWMNPVDVAKLAALKNAMEDSVNDRRIIFGAYGEPVAVHGMKILRSTAVTADTLAVGQMKQLMLGVRKDMTMEIGNNGTDLTEGQKTVVIKVRIAFGVRDALATIYTATAAADTASITAV